MPLPIPKRRVLIDKHSLENWYRIYLRRFNGDQLAAYEHLIFKMGSAHSPRASYDQQRMIGHALAHAAALTPHNFKLYEEQDFIPEHVLTK